MIFTIRPAEEKDIERLACIEKEFSDNSWTEQQLREELAHQHANLLCCLNGSEPVGFCDLHIVADDAHINEICVEPSHRRMGAAHALMHHVIGLCKKMNCTSLTLEVRSKNEPAIQLYKKSGFVPCGSRARFYHNPADDAVTMQLRF